MKSPAPVPPRVLLFLAFCLVAAQPRSRAAEPRLRPLPVNSWPGWRRSGYAEGAWHPIVTTNVATMPFDFVDLEVNVIRQPQKFYRVRQP